MTLVENLLPSPWPRRDPTHKAGFITMDMILSAVGAEFGVSVDDIKGARRTMEFVVPRRAAVYLAKRLTRHSSIMVGSLLGGRDHTSVLAAEQRAAAQMLSDVDFATMVANIERRLTSIAAISNVVQASGADIRWRGKLPVSDHVDPLVQRLFEILNEQMTTIGEAADRAGISRQTFWNWRTSTNPRVGDLQAALNVMGYELVIRKRKGDA